MELDIGKGVCEMQAEEILAVLLNKIKNSGSGGSGNVPTKVSELENDEGYITAETMPVNTSTVSGAVLAGAEYPDKMWGTDNEGNPKWMQPKELTATWENRTLDDFYGEKRGEVKICSLSIGPSNDSVFGKEPFTDFETGICISVHNPDNNSIDQTIIQITKSTSLYSRKKTGTWTEWKKTDAAAYGEYLPVTGGTMDKDVVINMPASNAINSAICLYSDEGYGATVHPGEIHVRKNSTSTVISSSDINTPQLGVGNDWQSALTILPDKIKNNTRYLETIVDTDSDIGFATRVTQSLSETTLSFYGKNATYIELGASNHPISRIYIKTDGAINSGINVDEVDGRYSASITPAEISMYDSITKRLCIIAASYLDISGSIEPRDTGRYDLGDGTRKWRDIYAANGTIQTSDRNEKNTIEELASEKAQQLIYGLKPSTYQMNAGTSGRTHWGIISQDIEDLLEEIGMTSIDFAGFIKSPKTRRITEDENGERLVEPVEEIIEGEYDYSLRYDEFVAPIIKVIQSQHEEIEALRQQVQNLINMTSQGGV